jgi:hypothetical protein
MLVDFQSESSHMDKNKDNKMICRKNDDKSQWNTPIKQKSTFVLICNEFDRVNGWDLI